MLFAFNHVDMEMTSRAVLMRHSYMFSNKFKIYSVFFKRSFILNYICMHMCMCLCSCKYKCLWNSQNGISFSRVGLTQPHNVTWVFRTEFRSSANNYVPKMLYFMLFCRKKRIASYNFNLYTSYYSCKSPTSSAKFFFF